MKLIVGNLKMNLLTIAERERYFESFKKERKKKKLSQSSIVLCPPDVHVESFVKKFCPVKSSKAGISQSEIISQGKVKNVSIGVQNIFWEERGSYTGEISASMAKNIGADYVILGHSERRRYFGETNAHVNAKITTAVKNGLLVILCIGETKEEKDLGKTSDAVSLQLRECLAGIPVGKMQKIIIAYEPVWAVGSGDTPTGNEIMQAKILIKKIVLDMYGTAIAEGTMILYGGSVKAKTARQVCVEPGMDGALVGGESLIPREFMEIANIIDNN